MREFASIFYSSVAWRRCRESYMRSVGGLCERCLDSGIYTAAVIVHHKEHLTPENINDESITLNADNLQALCRQCHAEVHADKRYIVDDMGRLLI